MKIFLQFGLKQSKVIEQKQENITQINEVHNVGK